MPLKEEKAIDFLMALEPVSYQYSADAEQNVHHGFIYQDAKNGCGRSESWKIGFFDRNIEAWIKRFMVLWAMRS